MSGCARFLSLLDRALREKMEALQERLAPLGTVAVAFSGGVDSSFLAWFLNAALARPTRAFYAATPFQSVRERTNARRVARELSLPLAEIACDTTALPRVRENSPLRCYHCKGEIMGRIKARAAAQGCGIVVDGSHAGDGQGYRPGERALRELGILSPLAAAMLHKADIRELSRLAGLSTWDKPSESCLATRIPYGTPLTPDLLERVEAAEACLWDAGCKQVRVRVHGDLARIEVDRESLPWLAAAGVRETLHANLKALGFTHITLDLAGYRSGTWDQALLSRHPNP